MTDTIVALATAAGRGAIGVIRVSGAEVPRICEALLGGLIAPRIAQLAKFRDADAAPIDAGLALYFPQPASFTGEHVLELQGHGGAIVMDLLLQRLLQLGCRQARPGEFSERAFLNGKMDIAQAEAVADLIDAGSAAAARAAIRSVGGEFSARIEELRQFITDLRCHVEAAIDFPDEELELWSDQSLQTQLRRLFAAFDAIDAAARQGALLREGWNVVISGRPNAGKSSLLNRLVGDQIAIVTDIPGTTRDVLRQHVQLDGLPLNIIDTAGLRPDGVEADSIDAAEAEGIRRARIEIARADHVIYVADASLTTRGALALAGVRLPDGIGITWVMNKIDLTGEPPHAQAGDPSRIFLSAKSGAGIELLRAHLKRAAGYQGADAGACTARRRHIEALGRAREFVQRAAEVLHASQAFELFAEELRLAQLALGEITGEFGSDDLLGEIFSSFCIGK